MADQSVLLVQAIEQELRLGTSHFDADGKNLQTVADIMAVIKANKGVTVQIAKGRLNLSPAAYLNCRNGVEVPGR